MDMGIPEARDELMKIAERLEALEHSDVAHDILCVVLGHMYRQQVKPRRADREASAVTPFTRDLVKRLVARKPDLSNVEIGRRYNINPGRVSDILAGRYD
jgi:hypothetical protein